jgi:hypothetical protein
MTSASALDGNALAGPFGALFGFEVTTVVATCAGCGARSEGGEWVVYVRAPGLVARCRSCERVQLRIVEDGTGRTWVELTGIRSLEIPGPSSSSAAPGAVNAG